MRNNNTDDSIMYTVIGLQELQKEVARSLKGYTLKDVQTIYRAIEKKVKEHLESQDEITVRLARGLTISSTIKQPRTYNVYGQKVTPEPKKWIFAKVTRCYNTKKNKEYDALYN